MQTAYRNTDAELVQGFARLDRLGIIEQRPLSRYRPRVVQAFRLRPTDWSCGPSGREVVGNHYEGDFFGVGEMLSIVNGAVSHAMAMFVERMQSVGADFARQHLAGQRLPMPRS